MQRYSTENEKMVQQREKSIAALKQQLEDTKKAKVKQISKLTNMVFIFAERVIIVASSIIILLLWLQEASEGKLDECQRQLEQVRSEVTVKSEEIMELLKAVECMQSKV